MGICLIWCGRVRWIWSPVALTPDASWLDGVHSASVSLAVLRALVLARWPTVGALGSSPPAGRRCDRVGSRGDPNAHRDRQSGAADRVARPVDGAGRREVPAASVGRARGRAGRGSGTGTASRRKRPDRARRECPRSLIASTWPKRPTHDGVLIATVFGPGHHSLAEELIAEDGIGMNVPYPGDGHSRSSNYSPASRDAFRRDR